MYRPFARALLALATIGAAMLPASRASALLACDPDGASPPAGAKFLPSACCTALGAKLKDGAFVDSKGRTGYDLVTAKLLKRGGTGGCHGTSTTPKVDFSYVCDAVDGSFATTAAYFDKLDFKWAQSDATSAPGNPAAGMIFDLGGPSNQVVVFPDIDHGPNPFESIEFAVYLTNNPDATEFVTYSDVIGGKVDPNKWNEAVVLRGYKEGWDATTAADGVVFVFGLPCGINFRYVSIGAGNNGNPDPTCYYVDGDNEFDAVAGLDEGGGGICPDRDKDGYADCACAADKTSCDCVDDPAVDPDAAKIHPGAPEGCASTKDMNCDGKVGGCAAGRFCRENGCRKPCISGEFKCEPGTACDDKTESTDAGDGGTATVPPLCMPAPCGDAGYCGPGKFCIKGDCVDPCKDAKCPLGQRCEDGECIDPCKDVKCPDLLTCQDGECIPKCTCLATSPCKDPTSSCVKTGSAAGACVPKGCEAVTCAAGQHCEANADGIGVCVGLCDTVKCPIGRECKDGKCTDPCAGKTCSDGVCFNGTCVDPECVGIVCEPGKVCNKGTCGDPVDPGGEVCLTCGDDAGLSDDASVGGDGGNIDSIDGAGEDKGGCGCSVPGKTAMKASGIALALAAIAAALARRRKH